MKLFLILTIGFALDCLGLGLEVAGYVRGSEGQPVPKARVKMELDYVNVESTWSTSSGWYRETVQGNSHPTKIKVCVSHKNYVPKCASRFSPLHYVRIDFALEPKGTKLP